mmetsp:Transcript_18607/g.62821  ORF Transcript_18607/g.62821 Transcript_18607/m.62821 type:complete len:338 (-) Transcript_18607:427-1440(-)
MYPRRLLPGFSVGIFASRREEALQIQRGRNRPAVRPSANVAQVRERRLELGVVAGPEREAPDIVGDRRRDALQVHRKSIVVGEHCRHVRPERDAAGARQSGEVDDEIGFALVGVDQQVCEDEAALGVRVADLRRAAVARRQDVAGAEGVTRDAILCAAQQHAQLHAQAGGHDHLREAQSVGRSTHVLLHSKHPRGRFDIQTACIERHSFPKNHHRRQLCIASRPPRHLDDARLEALGGGAAHRVDHWIPGTFQKRVADTRLDLCAVRRPERARRGLEVRRPHVLGRRGDEVSDEVRRACGGGNGVACRARRQRPDERGLVYVRGLRLLLVAVKSVRP